MSSHIQIFDTTLRDGEQTPGVNFTFDERLKIAKQLENGESTLLSRLSRFKYRKFQIGRSDI